MLVHVKGLIFIILELVNENCNYSCDVIVTMSSLSLSGLGNSSAMPGNSTTH